MEILSELRTALTLDQGMDIVWDLIREQIPVVGKWLAEKAATRPSFDGDGSGAYDDVDSGSAPPGASWFDGAARGAGTGRSTNLGGTKVSDGESLDDMCAPAADDVCSRAFTTTWSGRF